MKFLQVKQLYGCQMSQWMQRKEVVVVEGGGEISRSMVGKRQGSGSGCRCGMVCFYGSYYLNGSVQVQDTCFHHCSCLERAGWLNDLVTYVFFYQKMQKVGCFHWMGMGRDDGWSGMEEFHHP
jgi:hypothetical protein